MQYVMYILNALLVALMANKFLALSLLSTGKFGLVALVLMLFLDKIVFRFLKINLWTRTVREQLVKECPPNIHAGDYIAPGNQATYEDYLFSGCKSKGTCDTVTPDDISAGIIGKTEPCGAWDLKSVGLKYTHGKGWKKEQNCAAYTGDSSYLPDECLKKIWDDSGCTNIAAADANYIRWKKMSKREVEKDINSWRNLEDNTHRTLCFGPDRSRWMPPINCEADFTDGDTNLPKKCIRESWKAAGCTTDLGGPAEDWYAKGNKKNMKADMKMWAKLGDDGRRTRCYGPDRAKWPTTALAMRNNGTVSCNLYCKGAGGNSWNAEMPTHWKGAKCKSAGLHETTDCKTVSQDPNTPGVMPCTCERNDGRPWNPDPEPWNLKCDEFEDNDVGISDTCKTQIWRGVGCTTILGKPAEDWYGKQTKAGVKADMTAWATMTDNAHRERCYGPDKANWPTVKTAGNNGSVSCNTYCDGESGHSWNNELSTAWPGARCVSAGKYDNYSCEHVGQDPNTPGIMPCNCARNWQQFNPHSMGTWWWNRWKSWKGFRWGWN